MPVANGTSVLGFQTLITLASATSRQYAIAISSNPLPPSDRLGYFWVYAFVNVAPFQCFIVQKGTITQPGIWQTWDAPATSPSYLFRVDANWSVAGKAWNINIQ